MNNPEETEVVVPGTGWFQVGDWKTFGNKALISLAISVAGALLTVFGEWVIETLKQATVPGPIQAALITLATSLSAMLYRLVFPQAPTITKRKSEP